MPVPAPAGLRGAVGRALAPRPLSRRAAVTWGSGLFALAFAIRSLYAIDVAPLLESQRQFGARMAAHYDATAASILRGEGVLFTGNSDARDTTALARPPGYPLFLALLYRTLGRSFFTVQLVQNALGALVPVLVFLLARRLVGPAAAAAAGLLAAVTPHLSYYSNFILPDQVCVLPVLLAALLMAPWPRRPRSRRAAFVRAVAAGILLGVGVWLRANLLLLAPFAATVWAACSPGRAWRAAAAMVAAAGLVVAPITLRNWIVYHAFVPVSINVGLVMWEGLAEYGGERFGPRLTDVEVAAQEAQLYGNKSYGRWWASPDGIRRDRDRLRRSLVVIREHPGWYVSAVARRMGRTVDYLAPRPPRLLPPGRGPPDLDRLREPGHGHLAVLAFGQDQLDALRPLLPGRTCLRLGQVLDPLRMPARLAQVVGSALALPLVAVGAVLVWGWSPRRAAFLLAVPLYQLLTQSPMRFEFRFMLPMHAFLFVLAGAGAAAAGAALRWTWARRPRP